jgi:hypothetical protein
VTSDARVTLGDATAVLRCAAHRHVRPNDPSRSITTSQIQSRLPLLPQHAHDTPRAHTHTHTHTHDSQREEKTQHTLHHTHSLTQHSLTQHSLTHTHSLIHVIITHSRLN